MRKKTYPFSDQFSPDYRSNAVVQLAHPICDRHRISFRPIGIARIFSTTPARWLNAISNPSRPWPRFVMPYLSGNECWLLWKSANRISVTLQYCQSVFGAREKIIGCECGWAGDQFHRVPCALWLEVVLQGNLQISCDWTCQLLGVSDDLENRNCGFASNLLRKAHKTMVIPP